MLLLRGSHVKYLALGFTCDWLKWKPQLNHNCNNHKLLKKNPPCKKWIGTHRSRSVLQVLTSNEMDNLFTKTHGNNSNKNHYFLFVQIVGLPWLYVSVVHSESMSVYSRQKLKLVLSTAKPFMVASGFWGCLIQHSRGRNAVKTSDKSVLVFANKTDFVSGGITSWVRVTMTTPWGAAIPTPAIHVLPLLSFLLKIFSSPFPQSSLAATAEISFLWFHMCVTQMWGIWTGWVPAVDRFVGLLQDENLKLPRFYKSDTFRVAFDWST